VTLRLVAEHADMWHSFGDAEAFKTKNDTLLQHCADAGRDPSEIERTWGVHSNVMEHVDDLAAAGVQHVIVGIGGDGKGYDLGALRELVAWRDRVNAG
jgi:alkanesulfonate monooxygenase SsuD/methylene tetrahydromethanopterin reductase-like flavin-dependent oxidoreductase (luciferase family)